MEKQNKSLHFLFYLYVCVYWGRVEELIMEVKYTKY